MRFAVTIISLIISIVFSDATVNPFIVTVHAQTGVSANPDIDIFLSHWSDSDPETINKLKVWTILSPLSGTDPLKPRGKGAVLTDLNTVRYAELSPKTKTDPDILENRQYILYVVGGEGSISTPGKNSELYDGIGVLLPPGIRYTLENTGDKPLSFYIVEETVPENFKPRTSILVRYEYDNEISTNTKRVESSDWLFSFDDGLSTLVSINPVMYEPKSMVPPHVHNPGIEEVWIGITGDMIIQVGAQRRAFPPGSVYKVPADGRTPHTNINISDTSKKLLWMMKVPIPDEARQGKRKPGDMI